MKTSMYLLLITTFIFLAIQARAQEQPDEGEADTVMHISVTRAQEYAVGHNLNIKNAQIEVAKADKKVWETTASGLPQVNASGEFTNNLSLTKQLLPGAFFGQPGEKIAVEFGTQYNISGSLQATQLIFSGPYIVGLQASRVYKKLSKEQLEKNRLDTKASVAEIYFLILLSHENMAILKENLQNLQKIVSDTRAMAEQGLMEATAVDQVKIQANTLENQLKSTKRQNQSYHDMLKIQLGVPLDQEIALTDSLEAIINRIDMQEQIGLEFDPKNNIQYEMAQTQEELAALDLKQQKSNTLPQLSAFYNYRQNAQRDEFNFFNSDKDWFKSSMVGLQLNIPLFASGQRYSKIQQAQLSLEKAKNSRELARQNLLLSMKQARDKFLTALDQYKTQKENKALAKRVFNDNVTKFKEGMVSSTEFMQANNQYLQTVSGYVNATVQLLNAKIQLDKLMNDL